MLRIFKDQLDNEVKVYFPPKRIISLVPSQTEFLFDLGLEEQLVGITNFCIHPDKNYQEKVKVGGTKKLDLNKITELNPDLIIANKEENTKEEIEVLQKIFPVWISDIYDLSGALNMMEMLGEVTDKVVEASDITSRVRKNFADFHRQIDLAVAYFIWRKPYMTVGRDTFIHAMLSCLGLRNVFEHYSRYPVVKPEEIRQIKPDLVFLSSEPYPFSDKHLKEFKELFPKSKVVLVDGEYFSWYGSRLLHTVDYFKTLPLIINHL